MNKEIENYDCPHCGQDLRLPADAPRRMRVLNEIARAARREHSLKTREIGNEDHSGCRTCLALAKLDKSRRFSRVGAARERRPPWR